ncbi:NUMOD1 domain-containing DNA-binding protein [Mesonia sp.]|uniref:NUMOD1 domain-containing DNA-binding protein n=1 Tax=Mesonia sp. TaxID=1960830 RepID=UPI003F9C99D7
MVQLSLEDEVINEFSSVAQAARDTGISKSGIAKTCRGLNKTAGGYIWKYD